MEQSDASAKTFSRYGQHYILYKKLKKVCEKKVKQYNENTKV